jgi:beta-glucanase (GH16 family)
MAHTSFIKQLPAACCLAAFCFSPIVNIATAQTWILQTKLSDEFNYPAGTSIDTSKWYFQVEAHNNGEAQQYTNWQYNVPAGSHLTDYNLITTDTSIQIVARKQTYNNYQYTSVRLNSQCRMFYTYGKFEFRLKPPAATVSGLWPAVWMLGNNSSEAPRCPSAGAAVGWPGCGEVDVWEYQSSKQGSYIINGYSSGSCTAARASSITVGNQAGVWRIYSLEWNASEMKWWYRNDGEAASTVRGLSTKSISGCSSFTKNLFYIINIAVGGTLGTPISCTFPQIMELDYIRTYKLSTDPSVSVNDLPASSRSVMSDRPDLRFLAGQSKLLFVNNSTAQTNIAINDMQGKSITVLFDGVCTAGLHVFTWDRGQSGPGVFMATIKSGSKTTYRKVACY